MHVSVKDLLHTHEEAQLSVESKTEIAQRLNKADASEKAAWVRAWLEVRDRIIY